ncbi:transglutaminase-like domain-containing protein [Dorea sp. BIOML-A1]|uniref:transglutaminase-like domain-containing protein n=1 Tax=Dorea sp. BIOML-A1 TaxID=2584637 RepID=UPI00137126E7|nr:transglutaminase-like domain-containing protein [Dorea sp. BIOML-A1]MZK44701.1 transglutaminase domain-containing protein [Dorea sp. BIOML-A1]
MKYRLHLSYLLIAIFCLLLGGCSGSSSAFRKEHSGPPRDSTPKVLTPSADGVTVYQNDFASIDASNTSQGYVMVKYNGTNEKVKLQITCPDQSCYTYLISDRGAYDTFPLTAGNGSYALQVLENVAGDTYTVSLAQSINVNIEDEFLPFLYPNQYVNFHTDSKAVSKGSDLAKDTYSDLDVVQNIYNYVIKNISYDTEKAQNVSYGYVPDIDDTLSSKKGICFDYAALMASMLRSQNIPTKLEVGYSGDAYHAWISTYIDDKGWVDDIIQFNGDTWQIMDPTLAATNDSAAVKKYIGDGSHYVVKYTY